MAIRTSPVGKSLPLRDMFSSVPNGQVTSTPTPTTAVSTQSGLRSALSNGSARFPKNQFGTITSSGPPPGSAGHEQDSFLFQVEKDGSDESKWMNEYNELVHDLEKEERKAMFDVIKDSLEAYAEEGNVQMCAALAMAAHEELEISPERSEQFVQAYLDQLMRMSLHLNAAYVRKISHVPSLPASTTVDAFFHTNCGSCGKLLAGVGPPEARGRHAFCERCKRHVTRCSICHLPVRGILFLCHGCGHGGHQKCYQDFYRNQPRTDLTNPPKKFLATLYRRDQDEDEEVGSQTNLSGSRTHSRSESVDESRPEDEHRSEGRKSPAYRGRKRDMRRTASEVVDGHDSIPEKDVVSYLGAIAGSSHGGVGGAGRKGANEKRSLSTLKADDSTTLEEDRGIPDEEYLIVREKEAEEREAARAELPLFGNHCVSGCGHICWMTKG